MKDLDLKLFIAMHRCINALDRKSSALVKDYGLTLGQFAVLETLYSKGEQSISSVRDSILSTAGTIPVIVKNLEKCGLIERKPCEHDGRVCILSLSEKGNDLISKVLPENLDMLHKAFSVLSPEEQKKMFKMIRKIQEGI